MNWPVIVLCFGLPFLFGAAVGYGVGYRGRHGLAGVFHAVFGGLGLFLFLMMSSVTGWDGIIYVILLVPVIVGWVALGLGHLIGYILSR